MGIRHSDLPRIEHEIGWAGLRALLDDHGIVHLELEFLEDWFAAGPARAASDARRALLLRAAEAAGARQIKIGASFAGGAFEPERLAPHLDRLARDAANAGTRVGLEPMPFTDVQTPAEGLALVEMAGHPAAGLVIDNWHIERGGVELASLAALPAARIFAIELSDAPRGYSGSLVDDTFDGRRFPGEGDFDVAGFVAAMRATGYTGPWGVEMLSREFRRLPVAEATRRAFETTAPFLVGA